MPTEKSYTVLAISLLILKIVDTKQTKCVCKVEYHSLKSDTVWMNHRHGSERSQLVETQNRQISKNKAMVLETAGERWSLPDTGFLLGGMVRMLLDSDSWNCWNLLPSEDVFYAFNVSVKFSKSLRRADLVYTSTSSLKFSQGKYIFVCIQPLVYSRWLICQCEWMSVKQAAELTRDWCRNTKNKWEHQCT